MTARVLVVDDEPALRDSVTYALEREGFVVASVADGEAALDLARRESFDAIVLDIMLPGMPGTEVCRRLRRESAVPIVMLTAKGAELDRVVGLELGADDYVTKPFSLAELVARVRAILRRRELDRSEAEAPVLRRRRARDRPRPARGPCRRAARRADALGVPAARAARIGAGSRRSRGASSSSELWRSEYVGDERICDTHVVGLRRKVERDPAQPARILAVRGVGYKLVAA